MDLLNYFLADLPPEVELTPTLVQEACETLKRNRTLYLDSRSTSSLVGVLSELGQAWLQPNFPFRQHLLETGPEETGFSRATLNAGLDAFFGEITRANLERLLEQDLGHGQRADHFVAS